MMMNLLLLMLLLLLRPVKAMSVTLLSDWSRMGGGDGGDSGGLRLLRGAPHMTSWVARNHNNNAHYRHLLSQSFGVQQQQLTAAQVLQSLTSYELYEIETYPRFDGNLNVTVQLALDKAILQAAGELPSSSSSTSSSSTSSSTSLSRAPTAAPTTIASSTTSTTLPPLLVTGNSCPDHNASSSQFLNFVSYRYSLETVPNVRPVLTIEQTGEAVLQELIAPYLLPCLANQTNTTTTTTTTATTTTTTAMVEHAKIVSMDSLPADTLLAGGKAICLCFYLVCLSLTNESYPSAVVPSRLVPSRLTFSTTETCTPQVSPSNKCTIWQGQMRLFVSQLTAKPNATTLALAVIQQQIESTRFLNLVGTGLVRVQWLGAGTLPTNTVVPAAASGATSSLINSDSNNNNNSNSYSGIGTSTMGLTGVVLVSMGSVAFVALAGAVYYLRRTYREPASPTSCRGAASRMAASSFAPDDDPSTVTMMMNITSPKEQLRQLRDEEKGRGSGSTSPENDDSRPTSPVVELLPDSYRFENNSMSLLSSTQHGLTAVMEDEEAQSSVSSNLIMSEAGYSTEAGDDLSMSFDVPTSLYQRAPPSPERLLGAAKRHPGEIHMIASDGESSSTSFCDSSLDDDAASQNSTATPVGATTAQPGDGRHTPIPSTTAVEYYSAPEHSLLNDLVLTNRAVTMMATTTTTTMTPQSALLDDPEWNHPGDGHYDKEDEEEEDCDEEDDTPTTSNLLVKDLLPSQAAAVLVETVTSSSTNSSTLSHDPVPTHDDDDSVHADPMLLFEEDEE